MNTATFIFSFSAGLLAYLLGSVPFAVLVSTLLGLADPRTYGSHNPGATNVLRSGNKLAAFMTLFGDVAKGWLAVWLVQTYGFVLGAHQSDIALVALAVFLGHLYPVFLNFKGGKGVATALGVLFALNAYLGLSVLLIWVMVAKLSHYSSLAAVAAASVAPFIYLIFIGKDVCAVSVALIAILLLLRHRQNIHRLWNGQEARIK